jgi:hypothetical protein
MLFGGGFVREIPRQHEFGFEHGTSCFNPTVKGRGHPPVNLMKHPALHLSDSAASVLLVPLPVQVFRHRAKLYQEVSGKILRLDLAPLFPPETAQCRFVIARNDPRVRAADKRAAMK